MHCSAVMARTSHPIMPSLDYKFANCSPQWAKWAPGDWGVHLITHRQLVSKRWIMSSRSSASVLSFNSIMEYYGGIRSYSNEFNVKFKCAIPSTAQNGYGWCRIQHNTGCISRAKSHCTDTFGREIYGATKAIEMFAAMVFGWLLGSLAHYTKIQTGNKTTRPQL